MASVSLLRKRVDTTSNMADSDDARTPDGGYKVKTYRPTLKEMENFSEFMKYVHDTGGHRAGLAKIIPPPGYNPRKAGYDDESLYQMEITCPIKQQVTGEKGLYQQLNVVEKKKMSVRNFKRLSEEKHPTPIHTDSEAEMDRLFWKNIFTNPSIYGADVPGTLFDDDFEPFNLTRLNTILDNIQDDYGVTIQGVNTTYLYFGMWKSSFCWHTEDVDLYSINYLHTGQPKSWYCIAPEYGKRFERLAASFFPHNFRTCRAFLRHKTTLISPQILRKYSIPFSRCTQYPGEFMVTFPYSYHSGYNHGFNIAEATNFALEYWIDFGKWATRCECSSESVKISMQTFVKRYQSERYENWVRGKDVCSDPRDPKHVAPAPKPTDYDLYLMGIHERKEEEEETKKSALQQNQSSNVKSKSKSTKKVAIEQDLQCYQEYVRSCEEKQLGNSEIPHYCPIETEFAAVNPPPSDLKNMSKETHNKRKSYARIFEKETKKMKKESLREERKLLEKERKARERCISSMKLVQYLPQTFTLEKRFNRCIAAHPPHCSLCQIFVNHPKDDEDIWGPAIMAKTSESGSQLDTSHQDDVIKTEPIEISQPSVQANTTAKEEIPQPTVSGAQVEQFKLPQSSAVLVPRGVFARDVLLPPGSPSQASGETRTEPGSKADPKEVDSGYGEKADQFLDLCVDSSELIQCIICMLCVHKLCYGIENIDNKDGWICDRCRNPNRSVINCALCPCRGGALKSKGGTWMHLTCALCVPDVKFIDLIKADSSNVSESKLPELNCKTSCMYCTRNMKLSKYVQGVCIPCSGYLDLNGELKPCSNSLHVTCGHRNGAKFDYIDACDAVKPESLNRDAVRATCSDCMNKSQLLSWDLEINDVSDDSRLPIGSEVIVRTSLETFEDAVIKSYKTDHLFDVFYPESCEVEVQTPSRMIFDSTKEFKIGDDIIVKDKTGTRHGKFRGKQKSFQYEVRFDGTEMTIFCNSQDVYENVSQLSSEQLKKYLPLSKTTTTIEGCSLENKVEFDRLS